MPRLYLLLVPSGVEHKLVKEASPSYCLTVCPLSLLRPVSIKPLFLSSDPNCLQFASISKSRNFFFLQIRGILIGFPYSGPRSEVTDWRMEAKALGPVGKVRASLWFIGG